MSAVAAIARAVGAALLGCASSVAVAAPFEVEPHALLMLDASSVNGRYAGGGVERRHRASVRRARLGLEGEIGERAAFEIAVDLEPEDGEVELHELALGYRFAGGGELAAGFLKQPFGMENNTSSRRLRTLERSVATEAFVPDRAAGLLWEFAPDGGYLAAGAFVGPDADETREASARAVWIPVDEKRSVLHLGLGVAYRDNAGERYRVREDGGVDGGDDVVESARLAPESVATVGLEAAWARGSASVQAEWFGQRPSGGEGAEGDSPLFTGGYVQGGWVLGGGRRKYSDGRFGALAGGDLESPVELVAGVGLVDLVHDGRGDRARQYLLGANVELGDRVRVAGQVQHLEVEGADGVVDRGDAVLLRLQLEL